MLANEGLVLNGELEGGTVVGDRYRVIAPLARGGFGSVYVAEQLTTERRVALKILVRYADGVSVERLLNEARVTSRLHSDHIVQVIDAGVDVATSAVFVVMELLSGVTLDDRVIEQGRCSVLQTAQFLSQIAAGLDKAHGHVARDGLPAPIVHRDLKPSNLFLTERDDGSARIKILDFGAAKVLSSNTHTSGIIRGTPQYMAPEQVLGEHCTLAVDIWALGLIAFYLLTGHSYWRSVEDDGTQTQLFAEILSLPLASAGQRARELGVELELSPAFDAWFSRCVNRDPRQRFPSAKLAAAEFSRACGVPLSELGNTRGPALPPPHLDAAPVLTSALEWPRAKRAGLLTVALVVLGAVAAALVWQRSRPSSEHLRASATSAGRPAPAERPEAPAVSVLPPPNVSSAPPVVTPVANSSKVVASAASARGRIAKSLAPVASPAPKASAKVAAPVRDVYEQR